MTVFIGTKLALAVLFAVQASGPPAEKPAAGEVIPSIADRARGLERREGFLSFYWDARKGQLLLEVEPGRREFLYGSGLAGGAGLLEVSLDRGQAGNLALCRFERVGPRVLLVQRQTAHASFVDDPERTRVVEESFPSSVLASLPIAAEEGGRVLVDASAFLLADTDVLPALKRAKVGDWRQDVSRSAFVFDRTGAFPLNTEIETVQTFVSENAPPPVAILPMSAQLRIARSKPLPRATDDPARRADRLNSTGTRGVRARRSPRRAGRQSHPPALSLVTGHLSLVNCQWSVVRCP